MEDFPFIDAPGARLIGDGYALLAELGAVSDDDERNDADRRRLRSCRSIRASAA